MLVVVVVIMVAVFFIGVVGDFGLICLSWVVVGVFVAIIVGYVMIMELVERVGAIFVEWWVRGCGWMVDGGCLGCC